MNSHVPPGPTPPTRARHSSLPWTRWPWLTLLLILSLAPATSAQSARGRNESATQQIRATLEASFSDQGLEFSTFSCDLPDSDRQARAFGCEGVDSEGDEVSYLMAPDENGLFTVDLVTQPAAQVEADFLAPLDASCRSFLEQHDSKSWSALWANLHPGLQEAVTEAAFGDMLAPVWTSLGPTRSASLRTLGARDGGRLELQYSVSADKAEGEFRCGLLAGDETARVIAFLLIPAHGSEAFQRSLSEEAADLLSSALAHKVSRVEISFESMPDQYDVTQGRAWLESGGDFVVRAERTGRPDDFERVDFSFQVLDIPLIVAPYLSSQGMKPEGFDCPSRVVPDGGSIDCVVRLQAGGRLRVSVTRQGGDHRITRIEQLTR